MGVEKQSTAIKGGKREGAGRKAGVPNKRTAETVAAVESSGVTPLEYMLAIMRKEIDPTMEPAQVLAAVSMRFEAAKAAAPYVHAKLSNIAATVEHSGSLITRIERVVIDSKQ